jgi:hypothetical protein
VLVASRHAGAICKVELSVERRQRLCRMDIDQGSRHGQHLRHQRRRGEAAAERGGKVTGQ